MAVTEAQVRAAFQVVSQASSVEQANELLGSELAPLFNHGASGEGFSEFEAPAGDPLQISLAFPKVSFETIVSGVAAGTYGSSTQVPVVTVDKYGRILDVTLADIGEAGPTGPASGDLSGTYPAPTVSGLSGHALPALGATSGGLRWTGSSWTLDPTSYALAIHAHAYLPISNPVFTGILSGPNIRVSSLASSFVKSDSLGNLVNGTISVSDLPAHTHAYLPIENPTYTGLLTGPRATLTEFGKLRDRVGNPSFGALYAAGVTPATANYALAMTDSGTEVYLGASEKVVLVVNGVGKLTVDADEMNLASGVALKLNAVTVIDSSRNANFASITATTCSGIGTRPVVARPAGNLEPQDPATFLGTIGAAPSSHAHPYLPIANPTFTGVLTGPTAAFTNLTATGSPVFGATSGGSRGITIDSQSGTASGVNLSDGGVTRASLQLYGGAAWRVVARDTGGVEIDTPFYVDLVAGGKLTIGGTARTTNFKGAIEIGATTVIDASRNITGTTVKGLNAAGIGIRPAVALADGTFDDQDAATFRGTIGAAAAVHDHTSITGSAAKLTTPRSIGMSGDGTWSVSFDGSTNVSGAMTLASIITAGGPVGSATKAPQFTWDSKGRLTAVDEVAITPAWSSITSKPTTFSGLNVTMLASDIPNHASRHHWDGADPLVGQSIAGLRTTSSPTFYNLNISEGIYFLSNSNSISTSLSDTIFRTDGSVRFRISPSEIRATVQFRAPFGGFDNLSGGGNVRADSSGQLVVGSLLESELPAHTHPYLPITNPAFTGSLSGPSASFTGLVSASSFHASSNGLGENFRVGDDLWIGDVNLSHTALLKGYSDPTRAFLKFGTSGPVFGSNGSVFSISHLTGSTSRLVTVSSGGELGATSWANDGPWLPLSGAARVSGWVAFDSAVYSTSIIGFSGYTLHQLSIEAHTAFSFTGAAVSFLSVVSFGSSVQSSNSFSFLPVSQTATLGDYGSNKASIPSTSTTVYLKEGTGTQHRNYSAPILPDGQIQIYYGMRYGAPINSPQLFAAPDHAIYNAIGEEIASPSSAVSVFGVMIVQARGGDLFVLNRGNLT